MIQITTKWTEKMHFESSSRDLTTSMDVPAPLGTDQGLTPKQLVLSAITGCTGMDVAAFLRKNKQTPTLFEIKASAEKTTSGYPEVFAKVDLKFNFEGSELTKEVLLEGIKLSQTKYCGVSAMIAKACPIHYEVFLNQEKVGEGKAQFS